MLRSGWCAWCGLWFERYTKAKGGPAPRYCSARCRSAVNHARAMADGRYAKQCARKVANRIPVGPHEKVCTYCGARYIAQRSDRMYCSARCQRRVYSERRIADGRLKAATERARPRRRAWRRANKQRYDERVRAVTVAPVDPDEILERDGWRCRLCGYKVRRNVAYNHPKAATIDHIVPLSRGGMHEPANVQAAHRECNVRKSAFGSGEQLALI